MARKHRENPTQRDRILEYISRVGFITTWDAYKELGISQLGTRIFELKAHGYKFRKERVNTKNRFGDPSHYDKYYLVEETDG